ncbi:histone acetyltransferase KAT6A-like [Aedes albopictus]|uniref:GIY-YIG domain-containing protein n=2 Tax=Aedes albopictus TaxID=7160 RepID=A0ABM1YHZ1_AEDAL
MKINVAMNFIKRVLQLTTDGQIEQQKNQIFQNLRRNDYPSSLINRMLNRITSNNAPPPPTSQRPPPPPLSPGPPPPALPQSTPTSTQLLPSLPSPPPPPLQTSPSMSPPMQLQPSITNPPTEQHQTNSPQRDHQHQATEVLYRSMPNIPTLIRTISNILKKEYNQVKIATRNIKTTKSLLRPIKDPVPPNDQHNIVYSTPCNNCEGVYIGMTTNQLKKRMSGHKSDVNKIVNTPTDITQAKTALTQHMIEHNHTFNLDGTKIVDRTLRSTALPILEMCHIQNTSNTINFRTDVDGLNTAYAGILHTIKTTNSRREQLRNSTHNTHH